jgi:endonuclease/exonuclease/phosphatase family metal-dependent hydrolase
MEAAPAWVDAWNVVHPGARHLHTNGVHDRVQWPHPHTCDFIFVTTDLAPRLRRFEVDLQTSASDHQPLLVEIDPAG